MMSQLQGTSSKFKYTATRIIWSSFWKIELDYQLLLIIDAFKYIDSNAGSIFLDN